MGWINQQRLQDKQFFFAGPGSTKMNQPTHRDVGTTAFCQKLTTRIVYVVVVFSMAGEEFQPEKRPSSPRDVDSGDRNGNTASWLNIAASQNSNPLPSRSSVSELNFLSLQIS